MQFVEGFFHDLAQVTALAGVNHDLAKHGHGASLASQ
jgi:hypothetical protein